MTKSLAARFSGGQAGPGAERKSGRPSRPAQGKKKNLAGPAGRPRKRKKSGRASRPARERKKIRPGRQAGRPGGWPAGLQGLGPRSSKLVKIIGNSCNSGSFRSFRGSQMNVILSMLKMSKNTVQSGGPGKTYAKCIWKYNSNENSVKTYTRTWKHAKSLEIHAFLSSHRAHAAIGAKT